MSFDNDLSPEFAAMVDELKHEIGCIASFLDGIQLRRMIDATKTTGPALNGERYDTLAVDAISQGDRASCIGFMLMGMVSDAIDDEATKFEGLDVDEYHPVDRPAFRKQQG